MPIYEYLCPDCNRIYSFLSQAYNPDKTPTCPKCGGSRLTKEISRFAFVRGGGAEGGAGAAAGAEGGGPDPLDDPRIEREMMQLMAQAENLDESDPRQLGRLMRRMSEISGEPLDGEMEEAVRRLEMGEDPERIEDDMGDVLGTGTDMGGGYGAPDYDDDLYSM
jgi:putative FmdB family regulatory protein